MNVPAALVSLVETVQISSMDITVHVLMATWVFSVKQVRRIYLYSIDAVSKQQLGQWSNSSTTITLSISTWETMFTRLKVKKDIYLY